MAESVIFIYQLIYILKGILQYRFVWYRTKLVRIEFENRCVELNIQGRITSSYKLSIKLEVKGETADMEVGHIVKMM